MWVIFGPILACLAGFVGAFIVVIISDGYDSTTSWLSAVVAAVAFVATAAFVVFRIVALAHAAAWLDGSRLSVRRVRTRTVDLAFARAISLSSHTEVERPVAGSVPVPLRTPYLSVSDGSTTVHLRLRDSDDGLLPPREMLALADAVSVARCEGAESTASWLRAIAADPRSLFS